MNALCKIACALFHPGKIGLLRMAYNTIQYNTIQYNTIHTQPETNENHQ
jgi:hypothetical protein